MLKLEYQGLKKMILTIPTLTGEESWKGKSLLFDLNETLAGLKSLYELAFTREDADHALFTRRQQKLDARCSWETGMAKENEHYLVHHYRISYWEPLVSALWRKNTIGTQILCNYYLIKADGSHYDKIDELGIKIFGEK